jgi:DNA-binding transcriptional LysR family regulator
MISVIKLDAAFQIWDDFCMLDLADLRAFARIADTSSISAAARALRMAKSSVSRSLARLEEEVGATLVERSTRHLRLTDAGLLLRRHARRILDDVGEAEDALGGLIGAPRGDLRISAPFTFAAGPLAPMLPKFVGRYPQVRVILTVDNRNVDLLAEEFDVAIRIGPLPDSELVARRLATFALVPCASPAYLAGRGMPLRPEDLAEHAVIAHSDRDRNWNFRTASGTVHEVELHWIAAIPEPAVTKMMVLGGAGIGWLPDFDAAPGIKDGTLVRVLPGFDIGSVDAHALYASHRSLSAKVRVFIDAIVEHLRAPGAPLEG